MVTRAVYRDDFDRLRRRQPGVAEALLGLLAEDLRRTNELLLEAYWVPADRRVRRRLLELMRIFDGDVALRQEDLAELAGTSRATVDRKSTRLNSSHSSSSYAVFCLK